MPSANIRGLKKIWSKWGWGFEVGEPGLHLKQVTSTPVDADMPTLATHGARVFSDGSYLLAKVGAAALMDVARIGVPAKKTVNYTVLATESGMVFLSGAVDLVFTLPATRAGLEYTFVVQAVSITTGLQVSPAAVDKIMGNGFTSADNKDAINTAATDREGDIITLVGDGVDGWFITAVTGTWARET